MIRGVVIGKFYPPHAGHSRLINLAASQVQQLTVIVCDDPRQKIPATLRAAWLREIHPHVEVRVVPDIGKDDDSKAWADYTRQFLGWVPEVVFTGEDYGDAWAKHLGSRHVRVDRTKNEPRVSGTNVRQDPFHWWDDLAPCVRAYFVRRVCVVGAESSGTTTLAKALAAHYDTVWVPEFGRAYSDAKLLAGETQWETSEFVFIADQQNKHEEAMARRSNKILICDTNSWATRLWHERYVGNLSPEVGSKAQGRTWDLYILTDVDIPFVQDGLRDGEHLRHTMHQRFKEELVKQTVPYVITSGPPEERLRQAITACDSMLKQPRRL